MANLLLSLCYHNVENLCILQDGQPCRIPVNVSKCEFCSHHVKQEYNRLSTSRIELQGGALKTAFKGAMKASEKWKLGSFVDPTQKKRSDTQKMATKGLEAAAQKAATRTGSIGSKYITTCANPEQARNAAREAELARRLKESSGRKSKGAPIPEKHLANVVLHNKGNRSLLTGDRGQIRKPTLTSLANVSLSSQYQRKDELVRLEADEGSIVAFASEVANVLPNSSDPKRLEAIELLKKKSAQNNEVPSFLAHGLRKLPDGEVLQNAKMPSVVSRKHQSGTFEPANKNLYSAAKPKIDSNKSSSSAPSHSGKQSKEQIRPINSVKKQESELSKAFSHVIAEMEALESNKERIHSNYKNIVEDDEEDSLKRKLNLLEKRDDMAAKMESTKSMKVRAWHCQICHVTLEVQHEKCKKIHPYALKRVDSTKKWWKCTDCNKQFSTVGSRYPTGACPKCGAVQPVYEKASMLKPISKHVDQLNCEGVACKEALLPRGVEQKWVNS